MGSPPPHTTLVCNKTCPNREYGLTISASLLSFIYYPSNSVCIYFTRQSMCCERAETNKERLKLKNCRSGRCSARGTAGPRRDLSRNRNKVCN